MTCILCLFKFIIVSHFIDFATQMFKLLEEFFFARGRVVIS